MLLIWHCGKQALAYMPRLPVQTRDFQTSFRIHQCWTAREGSRLSCTLIAAIRASYMLNFEREFSRGLLQGMIILHNQSCMVRSTTRSFTVTLKLEVAHSIPMVITYQIRPNLSVDETNWHPASSHTQLSFSWSNTRLVPGWGSLAAPIGPRKRNNQYGWTLYPLITPVIPFPIYVRTLPCSAMLLPLDPGFCHTVRISTYL